MTVGRKYRIRYKSTTQRFPREAVMVYLGTVADGSSHQFSARPIAGTQEIPEGWLIGEPIEVHRDTTPYLNRISK